MLGSIRSAALIGIDSRPIQVEVHSGKGIKFHVVGLPDNAVKESEKRIFAALSNCGFKCPRHGIIINLSPADIRKEGAGYDLPIALAILAATNQLNPEEVEPYFAIGELGLDGKVLPVNGVLSVTHLVQKSGAKGLFLPYENLLEASKIPDIPLLGIRHLKDIPGLLNGQSTPPAIPATKSPTKNVSPPCFSEVSGQEKIKRAFEIAAIGKHNILLIGPPGAGKSMLARRFPGILPPLTTDELIETSKIHSLVGLLRNHQLLEERPFRAPHHTISDVALVGGGTYPLPGEISLAHNGILFLDEFTEFKRAVLEVLRQPLETKSIQISRARLTLSYPSNFLLIAAMNPCPCGFLNHPTKNCSCPAGVVQRYLSKISGPLLDRIDLHVEVSPVPIADLQMNAFTAEKSATIKKRIIDVQTFQKENRPPEFQKTSNAELGIRALQQLCELPHAAQEILKWSMEKLDLSARAYQKIIKIARTIADMDFSTTIQSQHIAEAVQYRSLDRTKWGQG